MRTRSRHRDSPALQNEPGNEGLAVRAMACVFLMVCCLGPVGCNTFGKKSQDKQDQPSASGGGAAAQIGAPGYADRTQPATVSGVLAGRVLDSYDRNPPPAFIKVVQAAAQRRQRPGTRRSRHRWTRVFRRPGFAAWTALSTHRPHSGWQSQACRHGLGHSPQPENPHLHE